MPATGQAHVRDLARWVDELASEYAPYESHPLMRRKPEAVGLRQKVADAKIAHHDAQRELDAHTKAFHALGAEVQKSARAVREQVDWDRVRADTAHNDFAVAFLVLTDRLGITA